MAKKPAITTIASGYYSRQALNNNFESLRTGFDNTLSLDGSTPNAMQADLDMNGNDIFNASSLIVNGEDVVATTAAALSAAQVALVAAQTAETSAEASETASALSETNAATSEANASSSATAANTSAVNAATSEANSSTSASAASVSAAAALASETAAAASESIVIASASAAATSATAASSSASTASAASDAALAALDSFDDRYLGQKTIDPTLDNDGDPLVAGALYFNTSDDIMKVFDGSLWVAAYASLSGAMFGANNLSDVVDATASRVNLGLGSASTTESTDYATAAQGTLADSALQSITGESIQNLSDVATMTPADGQALVYDTVNGWQAEDMAGGIAYTKQTAAYTIAANEGVIADTSAGSWTLTLPATPLAGDTVMVVDGADWSINNLTVARNGSTIEGDAEDMVMNIGGAAVQFTYDGTTWQTYVQVGALAGLGTTRVNFVATEDQTVFSVTYSAGFVDVYLNGIKLIAGTDFTATNGTTIVLTAGATAGDTVDVVAYDTFSVADTYSVAGADATFVNVTGDTVTGDLVVTGSVTAGSFVGVKEPFAPVAVTGTTPSLDVGTYNYFDNGTLTGDTTVTFASVPTEARWAYSFEANNLNIWDVSTASYLQSFSVNAQETSPFALFFKPDGTKMYVLGTSGDDVNEYNLSTAWDVSTAVFLQLRSVAAQETAPYGLFFKPDGTKMYVVGGVGQDINEYDLSTPWNVTTASFLQLKSVAAQDTIPIGLSFKPDGTKMYVLGLSGVDVNEYDLSTAWDVSTAVFLQLFSVAAQETSPYGLSFKPDGTKMYVMGTAGDSVYEYNLNTPWDVSTAVFLQLKSVSAQDISPLGLFFKPDGTKMYVLGSFGDSVYEYDVGATTAVTLPASVQNPPTEVTEIGSTVTYEFATLDGGTTVRLINEEVL